MEKHFVCKGECGAVAEMEKVCEDDTCSMNGRIMEECNCTDGMHGKETQETNVNIG